MKKSLSRSVAWSGAALWLAPLLFAADPTPISRGESGNALKDVTKAMELMQVDPGERLHRRLGRRAKDIRFRMLVRKNDDPQLSPEYAWSTRAKAKGNAPQVVYPYDELLAGEGGRATVRFRINHEGRVDLSMVLDATKPAFGRAAQAAIETMIFTPGKKKDGSPALILCDADFEFKPDGTADVLVTDEMKDLLKAIRQGTGGVSASTELDARLSPLNTTSPLYPTVLARGGAVGSATVEFIVDEAGWVALPRVVSATEPEFGAAAVQAISLWQFKPPVKGGHAVNTRTRIEIEFNPGPRPAK